MHSIGTLIAIEGVDVAPQLAGHVTDYFFDSGDDVQKGAKLVQLDTSVEEADLANNKATLHQANLDYDRQSKLVKQGAVSQATARCNHRQTRLAAGCRSKDGGDHRARRPSPRRSPAGSACATWRRGNM